MLTYVTDIELSLPATNITFPPGVTHVLALLRWQGRPAGLVRLTAPISATQWQTVLDHYLQTDTESVASVEPTALVSIVVCTHERPDDLQRCLNGLLPLFEAGHEVLVVDNAPCSPRTAQIAARYPFRYLCEPRIGLNNARNCGLQAARHSIVAFTDDDAVPDANWVNALGQPFAAPEVGCVTGLVLPLELETPAQEQFEIYCAHRRSFVQQVFAAPQLPPAAAGVAGMGANMAVRRELVLSLGGFDPRLDGGTATCSGGDTDMFARILEAGFQIVYNPDALVWHRHRRDELELRKCIFGYGVGLYSFLTKRLVEARDWQTCLIAVRWWVGPFVKAAQHYWRGEATVPLVLLLAEAGGAFLGPWRFWQENTKVKNLALNAFKYQPRKSDD